jgi:hypothetical protein
MDLSFNKMKITINYYFSIKTKFFESTIGGGENGFKKLHNEGK